MRILLVVSLLTVAAISAPRLANGSAATITFSAPTIDVNTPGVVTTHDQTGYFDVTISDTVGTDTLAQFQASLELNPGFSNVSIVGADLGQLSNSYSGPDGIGDAAGSSPNLIDPYVFNGNSGDVSNGGIPYYDSTDADNSDETNTGTFIMAANTVYSLEQVYYDIPAGTPVGIYPLFFDQNPQSIDPGGDYVNLVSNSNTAATTLPGGVVNGAIIVFGPEPSSVMLMALGAIGLFGLGVRRSRWV